MPLIWKIETHTKKPQNATYRKQRLCREKNKLKKKSANLVKRYKFLVIK